MNDGRANRRKNAMQPLNFPPGGGTAAVSLAADDRSNATSCVIVADKLRNSLKSAVASSIAVPLAPFCWLSALSRPIGARFWQATIIGRRNQHFQQKRGSKCLISTKEIVYVPIPAD